jgi:hypothetical protein
MAWDTVSTYFSGQGVVLLGDRDTVTGKGSNFIPMGNVSELKISIATSVVEHKESSTGQRGIDLRMTTEVKATLMMTLEDYSPVNLALALRGDTVTIPSGSVVAEPNVFNAGRVATLDHLGVASIVVRRGATPLVPYTNAVTPYDYQTNPEAGSIMFNDGQSGPACSAITTLGTAAATPFAAVAGTSLTLTFAAVPAHARVGKRVVVAGLSGADAARVNGRAWMITALTATTVTVALNAIRVVTGSVTTLATFDGDATIVAD